MSESTSRYSLRQGLPIALACALAAGLGGCSTFGFGGLQACHSDSWPTQVMGSVQRADTASDVPEYEPEPEYEPTPERVAEHQPAAVAPPTVDESTKHLPDDTVPAMETAPEEPAKMGPEAPAEMSAEAAPQVPSTLPAPAAPSVEPPAAQGPKVEPQEEVARLPEPVPPRAPPPPEVVMVCGATDTACQEQLAALLADPLHKWIREKPTPRDESTGARLLAYRVLAPILACKDLRHGRRETQAAIADSEGATPAESTETDRSTEWIQLLRRAVNFELRAEIRKRC
jgi:hypothetical protein